MLRDLRALNLAELYKSMVLSEKAKQESNSPKRRNENIHIENGFTNAAQTQEQKVGEMMGNGNKTVHGQMKMIMRLQKAGGFHISALPENPENQTARAFLVEQVMRHMVERKKLIFQDTALGGNPRQRVNRLIVRSDKEMNRKFLDVNKELLKEQDPNYRRLKRLRQPIWSLSEIDDFLERIGYEANEADIGESEDGEQQSPYETEITDEIIQRVRKDPQFKPILQQIYQHTLLREIKKRNLSKKGAWKK